MKVYLYQLFTFVSIGVGCLYAADPPNIILIQVDDLGYGDLKNTGHPFIRTPNIDQLSAEGAKFNHWYAAASICTPSRGALMTGRLPYRLGLYSFIFDGDEVHLPRNETTLPQLLSKQGYQTAIIGKWHLSNNGGNDSTALHPDFRHYGWDYWYSSANNTIILNKPSWYHNGTNVGTQNGLAANIVGRETLEWINNQRAPGQPFFLYVNFYEPHWKVDGPEELVNYYAPNYPTGQEQRAHYPECIENVDTEIGSILAAINSDTSLKNTVIIFTSDNGPGQYSTNNAEIRNDGRATPYRGNKYGLWDGSLHVPGIVYWPEKIQPGMVINEPVSHIDILPTLSALAGLTIPSELQLDGADISPLWENNGNIQRTTPLQWHHYNSELQQEGNPHSMIRRDQYVIVGHSTNAPGTGIGRFYPDDFTNVLGVQLDSFALYNIITDPLQENDIQLLHPIIFDSLVTLLIDSHNHIQEDALDWRFYTGMSPKSNKDKIAPVIEVRNIGGKHYLILHKYQNGATYSVYDSKGKSVFNGSFNQESKKIGLPTIGWYVIKVNTPEGVSWKKIIVT